MLKFISFSSGSSGNCYYLGYNDKNGKHRGLLIDAGVSLRRVRAGLENNGLSYDDFNGILLTHDHMDHIRNVGSYCKKLNKPVYATSILHTALSHHTAAMPHILSCRKILEESVWNDIDGFLVKYFIVPHDATQTVGYAIKTEGHLFVLMTDMGRMTDEAISYALAADTVVIESNYDIDMLMAGPYTYDLKMRICKGNGHLSNDECAASIKRFWHKGLKNIFLCHLSENNNTPEKAYQSALTALFELGVEKGTVNLQSLPRRNPSSLFNL